MANVLGGGEVTEVVSKWAVRDILSVRLLGRELRGVKVASEVGCRRGSEDARLSRK